MAALTIKHSIRCTVICEVLKEEGSLGDLQVAELRIANTDTSGFFQDVFQLSVRRRIRSAARYSEVSSNVALSRSPASKKYFRVERRA